MPPQSTKYLPKYFNVYRFAKGEKAKVSDCSHLIAQTNEPTFVDKNVELPNTYTYIITAVDVFNNESKGTKKSFKLKIKKK